MNIIDKGTHIKITSLKLFKMIVRNDRLYRLFLRGNTGFVIFNPSIYKCSATINRYTS